MVMCANVICQTCDQWCKQYTNAQREFDKSKCKLWTGRNVLTKQYFEDEDQQEVKSNVK